VRQPCALGVSLPVQPWQQRTPHVQELVEHAAAGADCAPGRVCNKFLDSILMTRTCRKQYHSSHKEAVAGTEFQFRLCLCSVLSVVHAITPNHAGPAALC
jgi:hypothetical protein